MKKVAILIGHRSKKKGAYSEYLETTEYDYMKKVAEQLSYIADIYERPNTPFVSEATRIRQALKPINKKRYELVISLHFNAFADERAHGVTALHYITNSYTKRIATRFVQMVGQRFGVRQRDLIPIQGKSQNGGIFITETKAQAVLLEPFFGTNVNDCVEFYGAEEKYANLIRDLICEFVNC